MATCLEQSNLERIYTAYASFADGDMVTLRDCLAEGVVGHEHHNGRYITDYVGRDALIARLKAAWLQQWYEFSIEMYKVVTHRACVAVCATWYGTSTYTGKTYLCHHILVARIDDAAQVAEAWVTWDDPRFLTERNGLHIPDDASRDEMISSLDA